MSSKIWFITGTSRGFGRIWTEAALRRGDKVVATARDVSALAPLVDSFGESVLPLALDVTHRDEVFAAVDRAHGHFGRIDVVVNNAGYGLFGAVEEVTEQQVRAQLETNFFGALWVTQAALPYLRAQRVGHIVQVSSIGGVITIPNLGAYHASKWALEGLSESLSQEVAGFGINVTLVEPGGYETDWGGSSAASAETLPVYDDVRSEIAKMWAGLPQGDPEATAPAILKIVDAEEPPLRVILGTTPLDFARDSYHRRLATWDEWSEVSRAAQGG
ncbi:MAG: SDR family oxidoreductase [Kutzneria sp.]|nr:SDR family oxidoreductase [Kutzneria sp.]